MVARIGARESVGPRARLSERPYDPKARLSSPVGRVQHSVGERAGAPRPRTNTDPGIAPSASTRPSRASLNPEFLTTRRAPRAKG
jgi:hypothetical protein